MQLLVYKNIIFYEKVNHQFIFIACSYNKNPHRLQASKPKTCGVISNQQKVPEAPYALPCCLTGQVDSPKIV